MPNYPTLPSAFTTKVDGEVLFAAHMNAVQEEVIQVTTGLLQGLGHGLFPAADATRDLGTLSKMWRDLYLSGDASIGGNLHVIGDLTVDGTLDLPDAITSDSIVMQAVAPAAETLTESGSTHWSTGIKEAPDPIITDAGSSTIDIAAGEGYLRDTNDPTADLYHIHWAASLGNTIPAPAANQETVRFIGVEWNGGAPQVTIRTAFNWNWQTDFPLGRVTREPSGALNILNAYAHAEDTANLTRQFLRLVLPFQRETSPEGSGGLELGETGTRKITMTAGNVWHGFNKYTIAAIDTNVAGSFDVHYRAAGGGFAYTTGTQWPNTQYDNGSGTLATMTNNRYAVLWFYVTAGDGELHMLYGRNEYTTSAGAQLEVAPTTPSHITYEGRLIARLIFQKSAATATLIQSLWEQFSSGGGSGGTSDHNALSNLQGGTSSQYYHLTQAVYDFLFDTDQALKTTSSPTHANLTISTALNLPVAGLKIRDTDDSHYLTIAGGSNLTGSHTLTLVPGDADRSITFSGNPTLADWFDQSVKQAASPVFAGLTVNGFAFTVSGAPTLNDWFNQAVKTTSSPVFQGLIVNADGLYLIDTNASHYLRLYPASDLTAGRVLSFVTGDADRAITLSGSPTLSDWFDQSVKTTASPTFAGLTAPGLTGSADWAAVAYGSLSFSASAGTWTVEAGDLTVSRFARVGKIGFLAISVENTVLSTDAAVFFISLPNTIQAANGGQTPVVVLNAGSPYNAYALTLAGNPTLIGFARTDGTDWDAGDITLIFATFFELV